MAGRYKVRKDRVLFVDVEMTCWEGEPPKGEVGEVIEVGVAELDVADLRVLRSESLLVRPVRSKVSPYCESLTGLTAARLRREGRPLDEVARVLTKRWGVGSKAWMAWGADRRALDEEFSRNGLESPFSEAWCDLGLQFTLLSGRDAAVGLATGSELLGLDPEWERHSGVADAVQAAKAWAALATTVRNSIADAASRPSP